MWRDVRVKNFARPAGQGCFVRNTRESSVRERALHRWMDVFELEIRRIDGRKKMPPGPTQ